jgi:hypothetical protein
LHSGPSKMATMVQPQFKTCDSFGNGLVVRSAEAIEYHRFGQFVRKVRRVLSLTEH